MRVRMRDRLTCIDLDQPSLIGFRQFVSCWLYRDEKISFIVDPGPLSTIPLLLERLIEQQVERLDYILLTHIHIDHAGGTGELLKSYPEAQVICHPQGIRHLIEPEKLWQGSQKVLGELAAVYGEITPVPQSQIGFAEQLGNSGIRSFLTPGHAQHHCCYLIEDLLFGGEVAGVHVSVAKGIYMRPATPPKFILEVALDSIQQMIKLQPRYLVIAHHGLVEPAIDYLKIGQKQLKLWTKGVAKHIDLEESLFRRKTIDWLLENDPNFQQFEQLAVDIQGRETYFLDNSLCGMREYISGLTRTEQLALLEVC